MTPKTKKFLPLVVGGVLIASAALLIMNPPDSGPRRPPPTPRVTVEVETLVAEPFQVQLSSYGEAQAATQSLLVSQVTGQIVSVAEGFRNGGVVKKGDVLVAIDDRDYVAEVQAAEANAMDAERVVLEERARAKQAELDWKTLGRRDTPSDLVLRKPQLLAAEAKYKAAQASLSKAQLALERTKIRAPFDGRILKHNVDIGQFINAGTAVAEIYANEYVEVRLPLCHCDLDYIDLDHVGGEFSPRVTFRSNLSEDRHWLGQLTRVESAIDSASRQLHVVGRIDGKLGEDSANGIKIGEYLTASIEGLVVPEAIVIPSQSIYQASFVYVAENDTLQRRNIEIAWQDSSRALISSGLKAGDVLITTPLGQVTSGTKINIAESNPQAIPVVSGRPTTSGAQP
ncbi:MAG: hypothetical protein RL336_624 [Pseudomonadota bacterium]